MGGRSFQRWGAGHIWYKWEARMCSGGVQGWKELCHVQGGRHEWCTGGQCRDVMNSGLSTAHQFSTFLDSTLHHALSSNFSKVLGEVCGQGAYGGGNGE